MKKTIATALFALAAGAASSALAQQPGVELGVLECQIEGGVGLIISSSKDMRCDFQPSDATFAPEPYFGAVNKFGIDIGVTEATTMSWLVLAPSSNSYAPGGGARDDGAEFVDRQRPADEFHAREVGDHGRHDRRHHGLVGGVQHDAKADEAEARKVAGRP